MKYKIITAPTLKEIEKAIQENVKLAFYLQGGIIFDGTAYFCVMIKKEYETK
jgi:hypothetical protein